MKNNKIIQGDCIEVMKTMEANSVDTVITDPPYGIGFMGKEWDNFKPTAVKEATEKSSRKKSYLNKGRSSEARAGASPAFEAGRYDRTLQGQINFQKWTEVWAREALRITKPGGAILCFSGTRTQHRVMAGIEDAGWIIKGVVMWLYGSGFPKATDISKQLQKKSGKKPKVVGRNPNSREKCNKDNTLYESGTVGKTALITEPTDENAKLWQGWKSHGLKPAYEPIIVAMKPNEGTYANNALKHGVSGLNIDGGRINSKAKKWNKPKGGIFKPSEKNNAKLEDNPKGRFPANIILDEEAGRILGEPSRFFYCAKASKSERNKGCDNLEEKQTVGGGGGIGDYKNDVNSMSGKYGSEKALARNNHPTVKPLALMEYLCTLTKTPTGGIVLDPFAGSGTTLLAAKNTRRPYIGIEREEEYIKIAEARLNESKHQLSL